MPYYSFATYADYREEWAIEADNIEEAGRKIGTDPNGRWLEDAVPLDTFAVECRDEFLTGQDGKTPDIAEITPGSWAAIALAERRLHLHAQPLLEALETAFDLLDRISDTLHYENGEPVSALNARTIEDIYSDAICELAPFENLIRQARGQS